MKPAEVLVLVAERVILPLLGGGRLEPIAPIGEARALAAIELAAHASAPSLEEIRARRIRVARRLCAVDALGDLAAGEWLLAFALNDLLQSTNATLVGPFGADRPTRLLQMALALVDRAGAPATVGEALGRHATFSRLLELRRIDTYVNWWVGSQVFRGAKPPQRLLRWRGLRRVSEREEHVELTAMAPPGQTAPLLFEQGLRTLLASSPLTDLAAAGRAQPPFVWTGATLALVATAPGRVLALRALERAHRPRSALRALRAVPEAVRRGTTPEARAVAAAVAALLTDLERRTALTGAAGRAEPGGDDGSRTESASPSDPVGPAG